MKRLVQVAVAVAFVCLAPSLARLCIAQTPQPQLTALGVRDLMKAGKTTAVILTSGTNDYGDERIKASKATINGVALAPLAATVENGKKIVAFRADKTVAAIRKALAEAREQ